MDKEKIMKFIVESLMKEGYTKESATAVASTMAVESDNFKSFVEKDGAAIGYLQWDGERRRPYNNFMVNKFNEMKKEQPDLAWKDFVLSPEPNVEYFIKEAKGEFNKEIGSGVWTHGGSEEEFKKLGDVNEALEYITKRNVRPSSDESGRWSNWDKRQQETNDLYKSFGGIIPEEEVTTTQTDDNIATDINTDTQTGVQEQTDTEVLKKEEKPLEEEKIDDDIVFNPIRDNMPQVPLGGGNDIETDKSADIPEKMEPKIDTEIPTDKPTDIIQDNTEEQIVDDTTIEDDIADDITGIEDEEQKKNLSMFQEIYNRDKELADRSQRLLAGKTILDTALTTGSLVSNMLSDRPDTITAAQSPIPNIPTQRFRQEEQLGDAVAGTYAAGRQMATEMGRADIIPGITSQTQQTGIEGMANIGLQELQRQTQEAGLQAQVRGQNAQLRQQADVYNDQKLTQAASGLSEVNAQLLSNYSKILADYIQTSTDIKDKDAMALAILDWQKVGGSPEQFTSYFPISQEKTKITETKDRN